MRWEPMIAETGRSISYDRRDAGKGRLSFSAKDGLATEGRVEKGGCGELRRGSPLPRPRGD